MGLRLSHEGPGDARRIAEARLRCEAERDTRRFAVGYLAVVAAFSILYIFWSPSWAPNFVPAAVMLTSSAGHAGAALLYCCRSRSPVSPQVAHTLAFCFTVVVSILANPEVQYFLYGTSWAAGLRLLGKRPGCDQRSVNPHRYCIMNYDSLMAALLVQVQCAYFITFVLSFRCSMVAAAVCTVAYNAARAAVRWPMWHAFPHIFMVEVMALAFMNACLVIAKWHMGDSRRRLFYQLVQREQQVVQERVKRCEAEFKVEVLGAEPRGGLARDPGGSAVASTIPSSGGAFQDFHAEDSEVAEDGHQRIAQLGRQEHWLVDPAHLTLQPESVLGSGGFGIVVAGTFAGSPVAVKVARRKGAKSGIPELVNELRVLRHVRHPNIALFYGACLQPSVDGFAIVLELVRGLPFAAYITRMAHGGRNCDFEKCVLLQDVCRSLVYLHSRQPCIIHGDLKPSNMLVEHPHDSPRVKLLDFGLSRLLTPRAKPLGGTCMWMAPEVVSGCARVPTQAADTFAFGRIAFFVITGQKPHSEYSAQTVRRMASAKHGIPLVWPLGDALAQRCQGIAERCLYFNPGQRPGMEEVHEDLGKWPQDLQLPDADALAVKRSLPWSEALPLLKFGMVQEKKSKDCWPAIRRRHRQGDNGAGADAGSHAAAPKPLPMLLEEKLASTSAAQTVDFRVTPVSTRMMMLMDVVVRWQCCSSIDACCSYHSVLQDVYVLHEQLRRRPCCPTFHLETQADCRQCPKCLAIDAPQDSGTFVCDVCDYEMPPCFPSERGVDEHDTAASDAEGAAMSLRVSL